MPVVLRCQVETQAINDTTVILAVISASQPIEKPIEKGCPIRIYKDGTLLLNGVLSEEIDSVRLSKSGFRTYLPIHLPKCITLKNGIKISLSEDILLNCEIKTENLPV